MNARVSSSLYGSTRSTTAELDDITRIADACNHTGKLLQAHGAYWANLPASMSRFRSMAPLCPAWRMGVSRAIGGASSTVGVSTYGCAIDTAITMSNATTTYEHIGIDMVLLQQRSSYESEALSQVGTALVLLADKLTQAHSLYSHAEHTVDRIINEGIELGFEISPKYASLGFAALAALGVIRGSIVEQRFNPIYAITDTWWAQEGFLAGFGNLITLGNSKQAMAVGLVSTSEVNRAASKISMVTAPVNNILFGDTLSVQEIYPKRGITTTGSIASSLDNVHDMRLNHVDYGSIAIEQFKQPDGTRSWMVTIPGTDGHLDSPFSWQTNIELMSARASQRKLADSARMVDQAMTMAGIQPGEPVAMVGHSQGGIVAATMASDFADKYTISHIVTAGSPIANHPIAPHTWVTSIEMNDELVSNLDGARNPITDQWLTVRGTSMPPLTGYSGITQRETQISATTAALPPHQSPIQPPSQLSAQSSTRSSTDSNTSPRTTPTTATMPYLAAHTQGTEVEHSGDRKFLSHEMWYMKAAWKDAQQLGSPDLAKHEQHFDQIVQGEHVSTQYFRGRISKN